MSTATPMSPADRAAHDLASYVRRSCSARTARGMRTPTGDYMTCSGGHAADDLHGAPFGKSGWFSWTSEPSAAEHDKTKEPLPPRPRGPHPYLVEAA